MGRWIPGFPALALGTDAMRRISMTEIFPINAQRLPSLVRFHHCVLNGAAMNCPTTWAVLGEGRAHSSPTTVGLRLSSAGRRRSVSPLAVCKTRPPILSGRRKQRTQRSRPSWPGSGAHQLHDLVRLTSNQLVARKKKPFDIDRHLADLARSMLC